MAVAICIQYMQEQWTGEIEVDESSATAEIEALRYSTLGRKARVWLSGDPSRVWEFALPDFGKIVFALRRTSDGSIEPYIKSCTEIPPFDWPRLLHIAGAACLIGLGAYVISSGLARTFALRAR